MGLKCPLISLEDHVLQETGQLHLEPQLPCDFRSLNVFDAVNAQPMPTDCFNPFENPGPDDFPHVVLVGEGEDIGEQRNLDGRRYGVNLRVHNGEHILTAPGWSSGSSMSHSSPVLLVGFDSFQPPKSIAFQTGEKRRRVAEQTLNVVVAARR